MAPRTAETLPGATAPANGEPPRDPGAPSAPSAPSSTSAKDPGQRHPLESLGHGSLVTLIGQVVLVGATFGVRVLLVPSLGSTLYGDLSVGLAVGGLIANLGTLGIPNAVARQLAHTTNLRERWKLVLHSVGVAVPGAILTGALIYFASPVLAHWFKDSAGPVVYQFLSIYMAFVILTGVLTAFFQGNEDALPYALFNQVLTPCLTLLFLALFFVRPAGPGNALLALFSIPKASLNAALLAYILATGISLAAAGIYTISPRGLPWRQGERATLTPTTDRKTSTVVALLAFALPLALVGVATSAVGTVDTIVLGAIAGDAPAGAYSSVLPLARLGSLAVAALAFIMLPVAARLHREGDMAELARSYATITKWILLVSLPFFLTFFLFPAQSLTFVYRQGFLSAPGYGSAPVLLQITCLGGFASSLLGPGASVLVGLGKLRLLVIDTFVSAGVDLGVSAALVPIWGSLGAAVAFAAATALLPALCVAQTYLLARVHPFTRAVMRPLLAVLVPTVALWVVLTGPLQWRPTPIDLIGVFFVIFFGYLLAIPLTRSIEAGDHHLLGVVEGYLGRRLGIVRRVGRRFGPREPAAAPSANGRPPKGPGPSASPSSLSSPRTDRDAASSEPLSEGPAHEDPQEGRARHEPLGGVETLSAQRDWGAEEHGEPHRPPGGRPPTEDPFGGPASPGRP